MGLMLYTSLPQCDNNIIVAESILMVTIRCLFVIKYNFFNKNRFCPSVFIYLSSVVPAIWLLELDKIERRLRFQEERGNLNLTAIDLKKLDKLLGVQIKLPDIQVDPSTWITLIEQFLMLVLIVGRWMLPKGDLTRDQLSQLLLVYIG